MKYTIENFTAAEREVLGRYFTNTDLPVFGLVNLPDVVKGALFARYSRSNKSLRRLFLDEFYDGGAAVARTDDSSTTRAEQLYDKMILDFGDDSVAQLGAAHLACEQVSNVLTKVLEKGRIASYLEQSTRYVYYNEKVGGQYRYMVPAEFEDTPLEEVFRKHLDMLFDTYTEILEELTPALREKYPQGGLSSRAWEATIRAKACDIVRGLLPAATRSNMGIFASGQSYELLLIKMLASANSEVREYGRMMLEELRKIIPSLLTRVDLEDRGVAWGKFLNDVERSFDGEYAVGGGQISAAKCCPAQAHSCSRNAASNSTPDACGSPLNTRQGNTIRLLDFDPAGREKIARAILFEHTETDDEAIKQHVAQMSAQEQDALMRQYCGTRLNRRHKPGRAFEHTTYTFEVLSDYGAFRDLQRHRLLTIEWQKLSPCNGFVVPVELDEYPLLKAKFERAVQATGAVYEELRAAVGAEIAQYVVPFACRVRYQIRMNLREAFHFIELRTQRQGHYSYRQICGEMFRQIVAVHPFVADCMTFVDLNLYDLARAEAEDKRDIRSL